MDLTTIGVKVDYKDVPKADEALGKLGKTGKKTQENLDGLASSSKGASGALGLLKGAIAAIGITKIASEILGTTRSFEKLNSMLITATGSTSLAAYQFERIQDFAQKTPYSLEEVTQAFINLKNLGLDPSEEALYSYGNTASAMGKSLDQMIQAVADAATGEFERLKEFGIKSSNQGNKIVFTFRGIKTEVENNAGAISKALIKLGQDNFGNAMSLQMDTINGKVSNMGDTFAKVFNNIGSRSSGLIGRAIDGITELGNAINASMDESVKGKIAGINDEIANLEKEANKVQANWVTKGLFGTTIVDPEAEQKMSDLIDQINALKMRRMELLWVQERQKQAGDEELAQSKALEEKNKKEAKAATYKKSALEAQTDWEIAQQDRINAALDQAYQDRLDLEEQYYQAKRDIAYNQEMLEWDNQERAVKREEEAQAARLAIVNSVGGAMAQAFGQLASMQNTQSKEGFENYKKFATAQAFISTSLAVMQAYSSPALPDPISKSIAAGLMSGIGALQIAKINEQQFTPTQTTAYALGGVVDKPTFFSTPSSPSNVMGEAGAEAIMPLKRGADGKLGVSAGGTGANINFTINAIDAAGIDQLLIAKQSTIVNLVRRGMS